MAWRDEEQDWRGVQHCRIRADVTNSMAWRVLSCAAKALYVDLRSKLRMASNGNVNATMTQMKHLGWVSKTTLAKALYELLAAGFLVRTRGGGVSRGSKVCSLYGFTDLRIDRNDKLAIELRRPSFEYLNYKTVAEASAALEIGVEKLQAEGREKQKTDKRRKKIDGPESGLVKPVFGPDSGLVGCLSGPDSGQVKGLENVR